MFIQEVLNEINQQLHSVNSFNYSVNEDQLQKLYDKMCTHALNPENYFHYFVSYGLLLLHLDIHQQLNLTASDQNGEIILYGDLFYSLYYEYSVKNIFTLIKYPISRILEKLELQSIHKQSSLDELLETWIKVIKQEECPYGVFI